MTSVQEKWWVLAAPVVFALAVGGVTAGVLWARSSEHRDPDALANRGSPALPVQVTVLGELAAPVVADRYRGVIVASKEAELAFRRSGRVESIAVKEGASVRKGDLLASLESADLRARIAAAESAIAEADSLLEEMLAGPRRQTIDAAEAEVRRLRATVELAITTSQRQQSLLAVNASSEQQYDDARSLLDQQTAALAAAEERLSELREGTRAEQVSAQRSRVEGLRAQLRSLEVDLADSRIVAPFDGVIARRYLDEGAVVGPESRAMRLLQIDPLEARFGVSHADAIRIQIGQPVTLTLDDRAILGTVARIEPEVDLLTRTQGVFVTIDSRDWGTGDSANEPDATGPVVTGPATIESSTTGREPSRAGAIVPGQTVSLALGTTTLAGGSAVAATRSTTDEASDPQRGWWVPLTALARAERGLWSLFAVVDDPAGGCRIERREVQVLAIEAERARVAGTLIAEGDRVVFGAIHRVTPGMKVESIR